MKTLEELKALKAELEALNAKLAELTDDELEQVTGGEFKPVLGGDDYVIKCPNCGASIPLSVDQLILARGLVCNSCGLALTIDPIKS